MPYTKEEHQAVASKMPRDEYGHFAKKQPSPAPDQNPPKPSPVPTRSLGEGGIPSFLKSLIPTGTAIEKTSDENTLLNVHVGNPLRKIVSLLEDIKKQKAFSFTLKGSLGIMGVFLALSVFGIFGGGQILCDKGVQSYIGTVKELAYPEEFEIPVLEIPIISQILPKQTVITNRALLIASDNTAIHLLHPSFSLVPYLNFPVVATGDYNSCSKTLHLKDKTSIELFK